MTYTKTAMMGNSPCRQRDHSNCHIRFAGFSHRSLPQVVIKQDFSCGTAIGFADALGPSVHVKRLAAGWIAVGVKRDFFDARFRLAQQLLTSFFQRFATLVDRDRLLKRDLAFF